MKNLFSLVCCIFCAFLLQAQTSYPDINELIAKGEFTEAQEMMQTKISEDELSAKAAWDLQLQSALLDRIRLDFSRDQAYVRKTLQPYYPDLTEEQLAAWEATNELEMRIIDGEKRYFRNAVWNLFRINAEAKKRKAEVDGTSVSSLDQFLQNYLPEAVENIKASETPRANPKRLRLNYTLRVKPDAVPAGEVIRAWLPYPRNDRERLTDIQLNKASEPYYIISPESQPHRSIYMEKEAQAGEWTEFSIQVEYTAYDEWHNLWEAEILPYDEESDLYKTYTAEREQHIIFTPEIRELSQKIVENETDPLKKAWLIYDWIGQNIPWASALEYSTMPNIPAYCIANKSGDCGMKALLFITLLRHNGIPAKWQSGWFLYPDNINLHDWTEVYFEGVGWVPMDPDFNVQDIDNQDAARFFFGGADAYRFIVNDDFGRTFYPAKIHPRSETVDFQRGEVEWRGGNLYFNQWRYDMEVEYID